MWSCTCRFHFIFILKRLLLSKLSFLGSNTFTEDRSIAVPCTRTSSLRENPIIPVHAAIVFATAADAVSTSNYPFTPRSVFLTRSLSPSVPSHFVSKRTSCLHRSLILGIYDSTYRRITVWKWVWYGLHFYPKLLPTRRMVFDSECSALDLLVTLYSNYIVLK